MKHLGDICNIDGSKIEPVWCITGGSPCQDLSVAGKRKGLKHSELGDSETTRSGLFMEQIRITKEMRSIEHEWADELVRLPRYLVWENVPGCLSSNFSDGFGDFGAVLEELCRVAEPDFALPRLQEKDKWTKAGCIVGDGWSIAWRIHDAQYFVPQRRRRMCIVADYNGYSALDVVAEYDRETDSSNRVSSILDIRTEPGQEVLAIEDRLRGRIEKGGEKRKETADYPEESTGRYDKVCGLNLYANTETGDKAATITANTGTSGAHSGPTVAIALDLYNQTLTGNKSKTLNAKSSDADHVPRVAETAYGFLRSMVGVEAREELSPTMQAANGMSGNNKLSVAYAVATSQPNAEITDGDICPIMWNGEDVAPTLTANNAGGNQRMPDKDNFNCIVEPVNYAEKRFFDWKEDDRSVSLRAKIGSYGGGSEVLHCEPYVYDMSHANDVIRNCGRTSPTLQHRMGTGGNNVPLTIQRLIRWIVRRLTPLECTRLQAFPDGWVDIGEWTDTKGKLHKDSDTPKYKALGNSICISWWEWMFRQMARYLPEQATLGSLFDGIGGFPLAWERVHGKGTARWASEIEEFPIAVTKRRFPDD